MKNTAHTLSICILCIAGIVLFNIGFLFLLLGFLPTITAYIVDEKPEKDLYKTVRAANLTGMLPTLMMLTDSTYAAAVIQISMSKVDTWLLIYGSAACGWVLASICKWFSFISILATGEARILLLEQAQKDLIEEWGEEISEYTITVK